MNNKELIINLIQQDLKHNQLLSGLEKIGLGVELHYLRILEIVSKLMNVPDGEVDDLWSELYIKFMQEAIQFEITSNADTLKPLAVTCYGRLKSLLDDEK